MKTTAASSSPCGGRLASSVSAASRKPEVIRRSAPPSYRS
jgi:hypothetical protein